MRAWRCTRRAGERNARGGADRRFRFGIAREVGAYQRRLLMCTRTYHDELKRDWVQFEKATDPGFIQSCGGFIFEARHCRRCHSSLAHPRDLLRYGLIAEAPRN
jgi:hypothetical protein